MSYRKPILRSMLTAAALIAALAPFSSAQESTAWKAGVATVDITPTESIWMAGFASRTRPSEGVRQKLHAKTLALADQEGRTVALVTLDLVMVDREMAAVIADRCLKQYGIPRDRLILNVSHTHSGPVAGVSIMPYLKLDAAQREVVRRYTEALIDNTVASVGAAVKDLSPATLSFDQGLAGIAVNRRRVGQRSYPGVVDHDVPVLAVRDPAGKLRAIVAGYACHATALNDYQINGDWPGYAKEELEKTHPGATALFVQGCGADANALPRATVELAVMKGKTLAAAVDEVLRRRMKPLAGPLRTVFEYVDVPLHPGGREPLVARLKDNSPDVRRTAQYLIDKYDRDGKFPDRYAYPIQVWRFGNGLKLVALSGEVVADYSLRLKAENGWDDTWVAGYSNDIMAYIPSRRVLNEGGYEGGGALIYFGMAGPFGGAIEEIIIEKTNQLIRRTSGN